MAVKINIPTIEGMTLKTKGKYVADDIFMNVDIPKYDGSNEGGAYVEDRLKKLLDATKKTSYMFQSYQGKNINELIQYNDTENVTDMSYMFYNIGAKNNIPQLNTNNVVNMSAMFQGCYSLIEIPQLNTNNVNNMFNMFQNCYELTTIDISSLDNVTNINWFASNCYSLTKFIVRTMTKTPLLSTTSFSNCYHFDGTINSTHNPDGLKDGRIYVPDNMVDQLKQATNWSAYADIIVPLSTLEE